MNRIGFIGIGHIAAPMVRRMVRLGHEVIVTERNKDVSAELVKSVGVSIGSAQDVIDASDIVFICLRPAVAADILRDLTFRADQRIISVMAELSHADLREICAPANDITRTIPFGFVEQGGCPLPVWGDADLIETLFGPDNIILPMTQEDGLNAILTASAVMASHLDLMQSVAEWTSSALQDKATGEAYIKHLVTGFLNNMPTHTGALAEERDALTLPGSLNHHVMHSLRSAGVDATLTSSLEDVYKRLTST